MSFLQESFFGNTIEEWLTAALVFAATLAAIWLLVRVAAARLAAVARRTRNQLDDLVTFLLTKSRFTLLAFVALWVGSNALNLPDVVSAVARTAAILAVLIQAGLWGGAAIDFLVERYKERTEDDPGAVTTMSALSYVGKLLLWVIVLLLVLDNLGVQVTALVTGMGIGGIAVALAAQSILGDLFSSASIVLDKPFVLGDYIVVGDFKGNIEYVGLKTTRLRSLDGEQLVLSNSDLVDSRIRNFGRLYERRRSFTIGVTYDTTREQLAAIPEVIREAIEAHDDVRFDRSHFAEYGDSALLFRTVYHVTRPEFAVAMDIQQTVNLEINRRFEEEGIEFAFPTRTVHLASEAATGAPAP